MTSVSGSTVRFSDFPKNYNDTATGHAELHPAHPSIRHEIRSYIQDELLFRSRLKPLSEDLGKFYAALTTVPALRSNGIYKLLQKKVNQWEAEHPELFAREMADYKQERGQVLGEKFARIIHEKIPYIPNMELLDVGFGDGFLLTTMKRKLGLPDNRVHGLETSSIPPIEKEFVPIFYDGKHIPEHVPAPHVITMNNVLHHFPDRQSVEKFLEILTQKLQPGGFMLIRDTDAATDKLERINRVKHQLLTKVVPVFPLSMPIDDVYFNQKEWRDIFEKIGLNMMNIIPPEGKPDKSSFFLLVKPYPVPKDLFEP
jgi:2-polyprenyl-3-methyl-5-hydroxy-6-metoxy-1,4-benzoquinol methylase